MDRMNASVMLNARASDTDRNVTNPIITIPMTTVLMFSRKLKLLAMEIPPTPGTLPVRVGVNNLEEGVYSTPLGCPPMLPLKDPLLGGPARHGDSLDARPVATLHDLLDETTREKVYAACRLLELRLQVSRDIWARNYYRDLATLFKPASTPAPESPSVEG